MRRVTLFWLQNAGPLQGDKSIMASSFPIGTTSGLNRQVL